MPSRTTYKAYRFRLYPKAEQEVYFRKMFGCCRLVYNHFLQVRIDAYEERKVDPSVRVPTHFDMCKMLTDYKRERTDAEGKPFLREVDSTALVYELRHLDDAFNQFYRRVRQGARSVGFPRFKKRGDRDSATMAFKRRDDLRPNKVRLAKVGWVNASVWREAEGNPVSCTVSVDAAERWWVSVLCRDVPMRALPPSDEVAVVRLGGGEADDIAHGGGAKAAKRIRRERRKLDRRDGPGPNRRASKGWLRQRRRVARLIAREHDRMQTRTHQMTSALVRDNGTIVVVAGDNARRTPGDVELLRQLRYKCDWAGRVLTEEVADGLDQEMGAS